MPRQTKTGRRWTARILQYLDRELQRCCWRAVSTAEVDALKLAYRVVTLAAAGAAGDVCAQAAHELWPRAQWPTSAKALPLSQCSIAEMACEYEGRAGWQWQQSVRDYLQWRAGLAWRKHHQQKDAALIPLREAIWVVTQAMHTIQRLPALPPRKPVQAERRIRTARSLVS